MSILPSANETNPFIFVGTYTDPEGSKSEGIYVYRMDPSSGQLSLVNVIKGVVNPSFLAVHPNQNFLYAVTEVDNLDGQARGALSAFSIDHNSGALALLNSQPSHGTHPCYVSVEHTGRFALVANYTSGSVAMFPIHEDGALGEASDVVQHSGSSLHPSRQTSAHAHYIYPDPANRFAVAVDLGIDKLLTYRMDLEKGKLQLHGETGVHAGAGPRHLAFHPNGTFAYLINELDATVITYRYHNEVGSFEQLQVLPALPKDFTSENLCADIHVTPDGSFLYASNRGHESIVAFQIDQSTGLLTYINHTATGGREPRNFAIDPAGNFLLAANQKTDTIFTFKIDPANGQLLRTGYQVEVSMPVCVKFVHLKN
ncbi:MAG TPA: lactonase family protein [Anaerolineales bacterium]|nr:lactonase family protein [Anaerolineales bacterium]